MMEWIKKGKILDLNDVRQDWMHTHTQLPVPMKLINGDIRIYYNSRYEGKTLPTFVDLERGTYKIKCKNIEPLLKMGEPGTFDDCGVMVSSVIEINGKIYMYYIGWNQQVTVCYQNSIGLAISDDGGRTFTKYSSGPILGRSTKDPIFVASPYVIKKDNIFVMYYLSCTKWIKGTEKMEPVYNIRYATSEDGIKWDVPEDNICIDGESEAIAQPCIMKVNQEYKMWYSTRNVLDYRNNRNNSYRIGYAVSRDGYHWVRKDDEVGIDVSDSGWDSEMLAYANVIEIDDNLVMFYNGNGFGQSGIGYAVLDESPYTMR